ncbi:MAG: aldo/keto reductase [Anaerovoracaceae bacterium]
MNENILRDPQNAWAADFGKLGFGLMRLPRRDDDTIDLEETKKMVDLYLSSGLNYFDTAWNYSGSEDAIREALVRRYPRDRYFLVSKLNAWAAKDETEAKDEIHVSLERTGAGYLDLQLLHALREGANGDIYDEYRLWDYIRGLKEAGLIRHWGFSWHGKAEGLEKLLTEHPDTEVVQLQINYADWDSEAIQSRANLEVCLRHRKPVIIMEPVKGGLLAQPPAPVKELLLRENPDADPVSWALRFAGSLPGIVTVLSGMSSLDQMKENLATMKDFHPLSEQEKQTLREAQDLLRNADQIPCTACHYCTAGCPQKLNIPGIFADMNMYRQYGSLELAKDHYAFTTSVGPAASECIACGQCEKACPQGLPIIQYLQETAEALE